MEAPRPSARGAGTPPADPSTYPGTPRWAKGFGILAMAVALAFFVRLATGGRHVRHPPPDAPGERGPPPPQDDLARHPPGPAADEGEDVRHRPSDAQAPPGRNDPPSRGGRR